MGGRTQTWGILSLLILFSLLSLNQPIQVRDEEWEELGPDLAALHRLRNLPEHMFHERLQDSALQSVTGDRRDREGTERMDWTSVKEPKLDSNMNSALKHGVRVARADMDRTPMSLLDGLQDCENVTACIIQRKQDFETFLDGFEEQKIQDRLLSASEISHSYSQKLLVMTDKDKSTEDRVQQEYSLDPHYSVIVSKDCLFNESCCPEADGYIVVQIFGSVSEDGQSVSGLSGSSLAELMFRPSLTGSPVFSLNGSTSTHFQQNFMHFFQNRGIKAVLETNQENHQLYQVMDQPGSVSSYRIPKRPVDHTTQYDHQQIIIMESDPVVRKAATFVYEKHPEVSSVYILDENQRPKLIRGASGPLSEDSRLVLVGHGRKDNSGDMRLSGYGAQDVAKVIQRTSRVSDKIKTTSVVACEVGSDKVFIQTLLTELHKSSIETELHLRDAVTQVQHTGEKITKEISPDGVKWRHKDDSTKVVANLDRNGDAIIRNEPGSKGEAVFTNERNSLMGKRKAKSDSSNKDKLPNEPRRFIPQNEDFKMLSDGLYEVEALTWGLFHADQPLPEKVSFQNLQQLDEHFLIGKKFRDNNNKEKMTWIKDKKELESILSKCYEIKSGEDVRNIIRHYAKTEENEATYLMINDWILEVNPETLYVHPVGKKLDNNQMGNEVKIDEVKRCVTEQIGKERYSEMKPKIKSKERYVEYVEGTLKGEPLYNLGLSTEAWFTTYFTASVISESARNFRTFPLTLMALDMVQSPNTKEAGVNFFFEEHPMATGGSWIDPKSRGFSGSTTADVKKFAKLKTVLEKELRLYNLWLKNGDPSVLSRILEVADEYKVIENNSPERETIKTDYETFQSKVDRVWNQPSGSLGGNDDGHVTSQDLKSASELENSFKLESYYSRASASLSEEIHSRLKEKYGESLAGLHLKEGSDRIEKGQFICELLSKDADATPVEFRVELSPESLRHNENVFKGLDTAAQDMEGFKPQHPTNKFAEHTGTAVGALGLLLGMNGAVNAFEHGDIKDGVVGALQTAHGVTGMTMSLIARRALSSETRITRAASTIMRSSAMKGTMTALPIVGIGFGIYSLEQDIERGGALGAIDGVFDASMVVLDVVGLVQPELEPFIMPINLALSVLRMVSDDIYMGVEHELNSLPTDAGLLDKLGAVIVGIDKGLLHFEFQVASVFYNWHYNEIEDGKRLVEQISDYKQYYTVITEHDGATAVDFSSGSSSWNGGGIDFCLADQGQSQFCMNYFVSSDETFGEECWNINTQGSDDIILGLGESHELQYKTLQKKIIWFIPAGSVKVVSGYEAVSNSRYGKYKGNRDSNRFFAVDKSEDERVMELMLTYYYQLYGEPGDDTFFLGPQRSYVEGAGGKDTYIIPVNGGKTIINNYDPSKALDTLHFTADYSHISVSKSGNHVVLMYESDHTVTIQNWFSGELYRHMNMMSGDGVLFEISSTVVSSVRLVARGINKMFETHGEYVNASQPLLQSVTNIFGSQFDDVLIGNAEKNLMDGGGGGDHLTGGEGGDIYMVKGRIHSSVMIENYSKDNETDVVLIEADLKTCRVTVRGDDVVLTASHATTDIKVTLLNWFRSKNDRHLFFITNDMISFSLSAHKDDCLHAHTFTSCIKSFSIDYSRSTSPLRVDLESEAYESVTEVRGSHLSDLIRGNREHNVFLPGGGYDRLEGRGGEDWYVITPGQGTKYIVNFSPDLVMDILFIKDQYQSITCTCDVPYIIISVSGRETVVLNSWFKSKYHQHLQIKTSDGITAGLSSNISSCDDMKTLMFPITVDYRNQKPEALSQKESDQRGEDPECFRYRSRNSKDKLFCGLQVMVMDEVDSVKEMFGSAGFDIMVGNRKDNLLDPSIGGALMSGGEGKDTYIIKQGYGDNLMIDNFANDQKTDTVLIDMDFVAGGQVTLDSSSTGDLKVTITTKGEQFKFTLMGYNDSYQNQHLEFQSSDGVLFKLKSLNSTAEGPLFQTEAFKVTLPPSQSDCRFDLGSWQNLSKVHTVQGCPSQSNDILGNDEDNALIGGWKDDTLAGGQGDNTLIGGNGTDILIGGSGDDTLYGEDGDDTMMGNSGSDVFIPGPGADLIDGGPGRDTVLYRGDHVKGRGVYVNLLTGQGLYADAEGDVLKDVETLIGTIYSDILVSGYESSLLKGSDGNDILVSTGGDYLVGGDGSDIYMLAFQSGSVTIDNCAKDNATDVLFLGSGSPLAFNCQILSDRVILSFSSLNQRAVKISLEGWISGESACGHLVVVSSGLQMSVTELLEECQLKQEKRGVLIRRWLEHLKHSWYQQLLRVKEFWDKFF
ncbi:uncharacterized protein LOC133935459 [Platichthys flesus]|uniref:uncharacterized protein LOC133935459 n=1 Tax=Platichthys flesus TaxID=8260 RepID=UPI002DB91E5E|nr:uncharacterized protein LOC133935459 [Platichthys flesus]